MLKLFDLAGRDTRLRFSPFCWRSKMALAHKQLAFETVPWRFTDKEAIARSGQERVPVLVDGAAWVHDSWHIALHLDRAYPDRPALMRTDGERAAARFVNAWSDLTLHPALRPLVLLDVHNAAAEQDRGYFRQSREQSVGTTLEAFCADRAAPRQGLAKTLAPLESALTDTAWLGGEQPNYADYVVFGSLQWAHTVSGTTFLDADTAVARWFERLLDLHDGFARRAPTVRDLAA
jgi:glutathione S-transferase